MQTRYIGPQKFERNVYLPTICSRTRVVTVQRKEIQNLRKQKGGIFE